ncbi:hypothetical protein FO519_003379 [Halicephalobus sp. NKZ332]|nr:hypothetical protein FO519_003379 [Halicephalobus sp. NKZ332]
MSHFSKAVLQEYIQDGFMVEDQAGLCRRVFPHPVPKCRPGGIPILQSDKEEFHFDSGSPEFEIDIDGFRKKQTIDNQQIEEKDEFTESELSGATETKPSSAQYERNANQKPETARSLPEGSVRKPIKRHFDNYARYSYGHDKEKGKHFKVLITFKEDDEGEKLVLNVYITPDAKISELIGLCCHLLEMGNLEPPFSSIKDYVFYLAEDGRADMDFPRVSPYTKIKQCCFEFLALVRKCDVPDDQKITVTVYFISGLAYEIEIESQDTPLEVIRDEAMRRKKIDDPDIENPMFRFPKEYILELANKPDEVVNLQLTVAQVGCFEFVALRKNSARGNFKLPPKRISSVPSQLFRQISIGSPMPPESAGSKQSGNFMFSMSVDHEEFAVERIHKLRLRWSATLSFHPDAIEVTPMNIERRRNLMAQAAPKLTFLDYDTIADVYRGSDKLHGKRQIKIIWIWIPTEKMNVFYSTLKEVNLKSFPESRSSVSSSQVNTNREERHDSLESSNSTETSAKKSDINALLEGTRWKTLTLETKEDDAWNIVNKLNTILDNRHSYIRHLYKNSRNGSRSPLDSAIKIEKNIKKANFLSSTPSTPVTPTWKPRRKITANIVPRLTRMLSKQD